MSASCCNRNPLVSTVLDQERNLRIEHRVAYFTKCARNVNRSPLTRSKFETSLRQVSAFHLKRKERNTFDRLTDRSATFFEAQISPCWYHSDCVESGKCCFGLHYYLLTRVWTPVILLLTAQNLTKPDCTRRLFCKHGRFTHDLRVNVLY